MLQKTQALFASFLVFGFAGFVSFACLGLSSCKKPRQVVASTVERDNMFTLPIGRMEDQIDLFDISGERSNNLSCIAMRDGLFYISNGNGQKISRYTSYGDILFMIYNEETNPPPLTLKKREGDATKWCTTYPLEEPGLLAVDSRKNIYVVDKYPDNAGYTTEGGVLRDRVVLHFDENGDFVEYLGREGVGGSPFAHVEGIYTTVNNELAVVTRTSTGWNIYWYDAQGMELYYLPLSLNDIPGPKGSTPAAIVSVDSICAAPDARRLYVKADYYKEIVDASTGAQEGTACDSSLVWVLDVETGRWLYGVDAPLYSSNGYKQFYTMLGASDNARVFLSFPMEKGYSLVILSCSRQKQGLEKQCFIQVNPAELQYCNFNVSHDGILTALLATKNQARIVWWRTNRLLGTGVQQ
jgi:hypothetical protein